VDTDLVERVEQRFVELATGGQDFEILAASRRESSGPAGIRGVLGAAVAQEFDEQPLGFERQALDVVEEEGPALAGAEEVAVEAAPRREAELGHEAGCELCRIDSSANGDEGASAQPAVLVKGAHDRRALAGKAAKHQNVHKARAMERNESRGER